jgi:hypothetical protein
MGVCSHRGHLRAQTRPNPTGDYVRKTALILALMVVCPILCLAQDKPDSSEPHQKIDWDPGWRVGFFGGYSLLKDTDSNSGFASSITFRLAQNWSVRADAFTVGYPSYLVVLIGPEYRLYLGDSERKISFEPFFNTKAGVSRSTTNDMGHQSSAAWSVGGGGDIRVAKIFFLRPVDINYIRADMYKSNRNGQIYPNHFQASTGFGIRF